MKYVGVALCLCPNVVAATEMRCGAAQVHNACVQVHNACVVAVAVTDGQPLELSAVLQGCQKEGFTHEFFCTFVVNGQQYLTYGDGATPKHVIDDLSRIEPGRRVRVRGRSEIVYDSMYELVVDQVRLLPLNANDRLLASLEGRWTSATMPNDQFTIVGAERYNSYAGAQTSVEYISVQDSCMGEEGEAPYLFAWDSKDGTRICYSIKSVTETELDLSYRPSGEIVRFIRSAD